MITLAFPAPNFQILRQSLEHPSLESAAILLCVPAKTGTNGVWRLIVRECHVAPEQAYLERTEVAVRLDPSFCLAIEKKARLNGWSLVYVHTHPHQDNAVFSAIDDACERALAAYTADRCPGVPHLSLLLSRRDTLARILGRATSAGVIEVGADVTFASDQAEPPKHEDRYDRQIRAFGTEGQARLAGLEIGIVGLGGTGSLIVQQLAHLGVRKFVLVDDDVIEASNLNRVVGAEPNDIGRTTKTDVADRQIRRLQPTAEVVKIVKNVTSEGVGRRLASADFLFNCTDTHASRHILNQAAYQFMVPMIDLGVAISMGANSQISFGGHVKMLAPGLPCLWCVRHLDAGQVRQEMMTDEHRAADPYFSGGAGVAQPSVISLNGVVASVAITMFLAAVAGVLSPARYVIYDGTRARMNALDAKPDPECNFCGPDSSVGLADTFPLPERRNV